LDQLVDEGAGILGVNRHAGENGGGEGKGESGYPRAQAGAAKKGCMFHISLEGKGRLRESGGAGLNEWLPPRKWSADERSPKGKRAVYLLNQ
jgi:hypothetical protein